MGLNRIPALIDPHRKCEDCGNTIRESYCSVHDEFYESGHKTSCPTMTGKSAVDNNHGAQCHRTECKNK